MKYKKILSYCTKMTVACACTLVGYLVGWLIQVWLDLSVQVMDQWIYHPM
jgi:hypothetical protein